MSALIRSSWAITDNRIGLLKKNRLLCGVLSWFILAVSLSPSAVLLAEESGLSLFQAIETAVQKNGELISIRNEEGVYDAAKVRAGLLPNPSIEAEANTGALTGSQQERNITVVLSQELLLAGKRRKRQSVAEREMDMHRWRLADRERLLRYEVKTAFFDLLLAKERLVLADSYVTINRQLLEIAEARFAAGDIPELELNLAKVELARSMVARVESSKFLFQQRLRLGSLMGRSIGDGEEVAGRLDRGITMSATLSELKAFASANRPDLKALEVECARADAGIALAHAETVPNVTTGLLFKRERKANDLDGVSTIGVRISVPIPVFDRNQAGILEARAKKAGSEGRLFATSTMAEREVEAAFDNFRGVKTMLSIYSEEIMPRLEENLKLTREAYRLGEVGIQPVIHEQKKYFEVYDSYLIALHERQTAVARLESVTASELVGGDK